MIVHNLTYNGVDLFDSLAWSNRIVLQEVNKRVDLRTTIFNKNTYHGTNTTDTLASGRLFTISWKIFGNNIETQKGQTILNNLLQLNWFNELSFEDDWWDRYKTQVKVYSMPEYKTEVISNIIDFTFELYSNSPTLKSFTDKNSSGGYGRIWGVTLPVELATSISWAYNWIEINNFWNQEALTKVQITWSIINPKVLNLTTWKYYWITGTTTDLVINNKVNPIIVEDEGINVKANRTTWSTGLILQPWINTVVVLWDDFTYENTLSVSIEYNDEYINS